MVLRLCIRGDVCGFCVCVCACACVCVFIFLSFRLMKIIEVLILVSTFAVCVAVFYYVRVMYHSHEAFFCFHIFSPFFFFFDDWRLSKSAIIPHA